MSIGVTINKNRGIVELIYPDDVDEAHLQKDRDVVAEILSERKMDKVFVDARHSISDLSFETICEHAAVLYSERFRKVRFALVIPEFDAKTDLLEWLIVSNGGNLKCFVSREEALAWLNNCYTHSIKQEESSAIIVN